MIDIQDQLGQLAGFALKAGLISEYDLIYSVNQALEILGLDHFEGQVDLNRAPDTLSDTLENILNWAYENGRIESNTPVYRDIFDSKLMNAFTPRPSEVIRLFTDKYAQAPQNATDWYYRFSQDTNYIRMDRIERNRQWKADTQYGPLDITINLSKPEKDPKAIAAAKNIPASGYPKCLLCKENEGYSGRLNHPARHSHRVIPLVLTEENWYLQYSPYVYYREHSIIFKGEHEPMQIGRKTFDRLLDFVEKFPHYFIGSNADLPIVGGSILSHDHFQGGRYTFAMELASSRASIELKDFPGLTADILNWPMSVIRLRDKSKKRLANAAQVVFERWKEYSDESAQILAYTGEERHNTVTPIARFKEGAYEMDLVLRNNRTSEAHPLGIFHPHDDVHHIKKENIGLIEVMGLAVLPARLESELDDLANMWASGRIDEKAGVHYQWLAELDQDYSPGDRAEARGILEVETGKKFMRVLQDAGVFKDTPEGHRAFIRFTNTLSCGT